MDSVLVVPNNIVVKDEGDERGICNDVVPACGRVKGVGCGTGSEVRSASPDMAGLPNIDPSVFQQLLYGG